MRKYNHVLVIIEPKREEQIALKRALQMAKFNPHIQITALSLVFDYTSHTNILGKKNEINTQKDIESVNLDELKLKINKCIDELDFIAQDKDFIRSKVEPKVILVRDIQEGLLLESNSLNYDLVIKAANKHGILDSILYTPLDWSLLRNAKVPVVIVKDVVWDNNSTIVVALDFSSSEKRRLNVLLLREAQLLSTLTHAPIHLINSAPVVLPTVMLEVPNYAPELYAQSVIKEHKRRIYEFAQQHNIKPEHCHIQEGMPDEVIPKLCQQLNTKTIFIGSYGRTGMAAAVIGNTCEEIVDYTNADLFVMNSNQLNLM